MPTLTEKIQQTLDQIAIIQAQGEQLDKEIKHLVAEAQQKQQQHDQLGEQFRHLNTRLATLREIAEPETQDAQQMLNPEDLRALEGQVPPEVFEQVKNVLADPRDASQPEPSKEKQKKHKKK